MAVHECVSGQLKQIDPYIIPQCPHSRGSHLGTVGVHNTSLTTVQTYDDEARHDILFSPTCASSHHAKLMVPFGDNLSFLTYFDNQSIKEWPTATGDEARAVLVKCLGRYRPLHRACWADCKKGIQKWASPFPSFAVPLLALSKFPNS